MITITPLPRDAVGAVAHLQLPPAQRGFVGLIDEMSGDPDPLVDFFVIHANGTAVGFFKIDRDFARIDPRLPAGCHGLRGLLIGGQYQRHGYGSLALSALVATLAPLYPTQGTLYLRVDADNAAAIRAYRAHGWTMLGLPLAAGRSGPELVLSIPLKGV